MVPHLDIICFRCFLLPFGIKSATLFNLVKNFNAPHRTGHEGFPHPALRFNSPFIRHHKTCTLFLAEVTGNAQGTL